MFGIGNQEMIIFLIIVLVIFGPKNLPKLAKSMGSAIRDFKGGLSGVDKDIQDTMDEKSGPVETHAHLEGTPPTARTAEGSAQKTKERVD